MNNDHIFATQGLTTLTYTNYFWHFCWWTVGNSVGTPSIPMSQIQSRPTDPEGGGGYIQVATGIFAFSTPCLREFTAFKGDGHEPHEQPQSASNLPRWPQLGDSNFSDSSGPIFSMYSKLAKEEDDQLVVRWQKDADSILIFVSLLLTFIPIRTRIITL